MEAIGLSIVENESDRKLMDTFLKQKCRKKIDFMLDAWRVDRIYGINMLVKFEEMQNE